ncbi:predicted protein [Histoplasma capsulatum G186AR]|uniref:Uncharacterized protein n=1 Tax=Ajellomyces capsulatus (strain G186AR / H82 / ATCC MYA-2454 / RMSCC 2432) TaxID=447093 RepID=C0NLS2_AJECG|nr:uncharacterized protein HCBG_04452 [Histoplasma capsulatum G186AR]EEH07573.1 predicted protein [Histoplasma capsulatum G186AR]
MPWSLLTSTFMISTPLPQWTLESFEPLSPHRKRSIYSEESLKIFISPAISSWAVKAPTAYPWIRSSHVPVMGMFLSLINISIEPKYVMFEEVGPSFLATNPHSPSRPSDHPAQHEARDWGYGLTSTIKPIPQEHSDIRLGAGVFQPFARLSLLLVQAINQRTFGDGRVSQGGKRFDKYANVITVGQMVENICTMSLSRRMPASIGIWPKTAPRPPKKLVSKQTKHGSLFA